MNIIPREKMFENSFYVGYLKQREKKLKYLFFFFRILDEKKTYERISQSEHSSVCDVQSTFAKTTMSNISLSSDNDNVQDFARVSQSGDNLLQ